mgnify:CR=1 FL=1
MGEGVEAMHETGLYPEDMVHSSVNKKLGDTAGNRSISNVVELKLRELGESPSTRAMPNQAPLKKGEGVEIKLGGFPKEDSPVKLARKILLGTMLGDACIVRNSPEKASLRLTHSDAQLEYLLWKAKKLYPLKGIGSFSVRRVPSRFNNKVIPGKFKTILSSLSSKYLKHIYDDFYRETMGQRKKVVRLNVLNRLTPASIAIWYADDGCLVKHKGVNGYRTTSFRISTHCFSYEEVVLICQWFLARFNIKFHPLEYKRLGTYIIATSAESNGRFLDLVTPYLIEVECLRYKIDPQYSKPSGCSAEHLALLSSDDMIRSSGKVGRPRGFKLTKEAIGRLKGSSHCFKKGQTPWNKNNLKRQAEMPCPQVG